MDANITSQHQQEIKCSASHIMWQEPPTTFLFWTSQAKLHLLGLHHLSACLTDKLIRALENNMLKKKKKKKTQILGVRFHAFWIFHRRTRNEESLCYAPPISRARGTHAVLQKAPICREQNALTFFSVCAEHAGNAGGLNAWAYVGRITLQPSVNSYIWCCLQACFLTFAGCLLQEILPVSVKEPKWPHDLIRNADCWQV